MMRRSIKAETGGLCNDCVVSDKWSSGGDGCKNIYVWLMGGQLQVDLRKKNGEQQFKIGENKKYGH